MICHKNLSLCFCLSKGEKKTFLLVENIFWTNEKVFLSPFNKQKKLSFCNKSCHLFLWQTNRTRLMHQFDKFSSIEVASDLAWWIYIFFPNKWMDVSRWSICRIVRRKLRLFMAVWIYSRDRQNIFDQVGHQTTSESIGNKYFFTK